MLALVALPSMRAGAGWLLADVYGVDVPGRASNFNGLFGAYFCASSGALKDEHPLSHGAVEDLFV